VSQLSSYRPLTIRAPPGPHTVTAWLEGLPGMRPPSPPTPVSIHIPARLSNLWCMGMCMCGGALGRGVLHRSLSSFTVRPQGCHVALSIDLPRHGQHLLAHTTPLLFNLQGTSKREVANQAMVVHTRQGTTVHIHPALCGMQAMAAVST
jgi:hypothetical protein